MKYTEHYKIPKPDLEDTINITDIHSILDKVDNIGFDVDTTSKKIKSDEETRIENEKKRVLDETKRVENEKNREIEESKRVSNDKSRQELFDTVNSLKDTLIESESKRVSEWNDVKEEANNIKHELHTSIEAGNKVNGELKESLTKGEQLKEGLDIEQYIKRSEYNEYKDEINVELLTNKTKTVKENSNVVSLKDNIEGIVNITVEGNTTDVNKEPILSDFKGKVKGSTAENPNVAKYAGTKKILIPTEFLNEFNNGYPKIYALDSQNENCIVSDKDYIPQQLYTFDLI